MNIEISATVKNSLDSHQIFVSTNGTGKEMHVPPKQGGYGSAVNGGELLLLSLATCFCNDLYREAAKRNIRISGIEVNVTGNFGGEGEPGSNFSYKVKVSSDAPKADIEDLVEYTDTVAEVHNTLRKGLSIQLAGNSRDR